MTAATSRSTRSSARQPAPSPGPKTRCLVTGGSGFLGRHLVEALLGRGDWEVAVFDLRAPLTPLPGVTYVVGDLRDAANVRQACAGKEVVFHCATAAPTASNSLNRELMRGVNVGGTQNVIDACRACGVGRLVFTSSASVVFDGSSLRGADESAPYAAKPLDFYTATKADAERLVLASNEVERGSRGAASEPRQSSPSLVPLATVALRPSGIFGEHDQLTVPEIAANAARGKLKYVIGRGDNLMDWTYAGNVAHAHLCAADALLEDAAHVAGRPFFVTNDDPRPFWGFMGDVCAGLGYPRPSVRLPRWLVLFLAYFVQFVVVPLLSPFKTVRSDFTPTRIRLATADRAFSCKAAREHLKYRPLVPHDEALRRTLEHFQFLRRPDEDKRD
ncbi:3-beta hydroxysteroid dehydrogenase/isomerase [Helicosporidium sp. ATCC 50920]|nr:3-beta hydroxysteroid dehydrogenase/isomerase [Helicosporidium sp. ATCC 50920]|eukprot:KDD75434.1 3-beta hydroxysteroid dehydrogenase/isomerase [Helicosporidium sp. ATCC 50920]